MRMARCWPNLILLTFAFITHANAATTLSQDITNFVPKCAQDCFISFLDTNFPTSICSSTPTLECLCSHQSKSGYTVGEGAVSCIVQEGNIGFCKGSDAASEVVFDAYSMCKGQPNALSNTHATIVATLVAQSTKPSVFIVEPQTTSSSFLASPTSTFITSTVPARTSTSSTSVIPTTTTSIPTAQKTTQTPNAPAPLETSSPGLNKSQVIGISVATVGGAALAFGLIILFACLKRRKYRSHRDSDELPFQLDPTTYGQPPKRSRFSLARKSTFGPGGTSNGVARKLKNPPPVPPRLDTMSPNMFSRSSIREENIIGLAVSPERGNQMQQAARAQRQSRLLPPKPTLKLQMPPKPVAQNFSQSAPAPALFRSSIATQFEEDGVSPYVAAPPRRSPSLHGAGLSFPKPALKLSTMGRQSTATQFEEEEELTSAIAELPSPVPLSKFAQVPPLPRQSTQTTFEEDMQTIRKVPRIDTAVGRFADTNSKPVAMRKSTATAFEEDSDDSPTTGGSRVRDTWGSNTADEELDTAIDHWQKFSPINPAPAPQFLFTTAGISRTSPGKPEFKPKPLRLSTDRPLARGIGSFSQPRRPDDYTRAKQLTPSTLDAFPKPPQQVPHLSVPHPSNRPGTATSSVYTAASTLDSPPSSPAPTSKLPPIPKSYQQPGPYDGLGLSPSRSPGARSSDTSPIISSPSSGRSPVSYPKIPKPGRLPESTIRMVPPPAQPDFGTYASKPWEQQAYPTRTSSKTQTRDLTTNSGPTRSSSTKSQTTPPSPISQLPGHYGKSFPSPQLPTVTPPAPTRTPSQPRQQKPAQPLRSPFKSPKAPTMPFIMEDRERERSQSPSGQSSLLAKRLGEKRAQALALSQQNANTEADYQRKKWRVLKGGDVDAAKSPAWRPILASGEVGGLRAMGRGTPGSAGGRMGMEGRRVSGGWTGENGKMVQQSVESMVPVELPGDMNELPKTPGWVPRLTPTRRGKICF
ncbi:hypothetical protein B0J14DRAFT_142650 [Halenospora varia]|nr:hypothetical protein B0J14DRAFT_142650 [Halenospora varia]